MFDRPTRDKPTVHHYKDAVGYNGPGRVVKSGPFAINRDRMPASGRDNPGNAFYQAQLGIIDAQKSLMGELLQSEKEENDQISLALIKNFDRNHMGSIELNEDAGSRKPKQFDSGLADIDRFTPGFSK